MTMLPSITNDVPDSSLIDEVALEMRINPAFVEKDWFVVQTLRTINYLDIPGAKLIFTGGTALSKAHRLIKRFSEDIDFRLEIAGFASISRSQQRKFLSNIKTKVFDAIAYIFPKSNIQIRARDENHFFAIDVEYPSVIAIPNTLRPHIKIEVTVASLSLPAIHLPVSSFVTELSKGHAEVGSIACINPVENAIDKLSALIWRVPDRVRQPEDNDPDLVRHLHDLALLQPLAIAHPEFKHLAIEMIEKDEHRCKQIQGLSLKEKFNLLLNILNTDSEYFVEYNRFIHGMSYSNKDTPDFDQAITAIMNLAAHLQA